MKRLIKIKTFLFLLPMAISCTNGFEEANTNPNAIAVGQIPASSMLENLLYDSSNDWLYQTWFWNNELIQFTAYTWGSSRQEHRYFISNSNWQDAWNLYAGHANNAVHMYNLATDEGNGALQAMALTFKVLYLSNLTDLFGDIPYGDAFDTENTKPAFDSQQKVYEQMFADLEAANTIYGTSPVLQKTDLDGMYGGDMLQWQRFNNSLYLRLLCRVSGREVMDVGAKMTKILSNPSQYPIFNSNGDNARVDYSGIDPYINYFGEMSETDFTQRRLAQQLIKMTVVSDNDGNQVYQDPRLGIYGKKNPDVNYWKGTVSGGIAENQVTDDLNASWTNHAVLCRTDAPGWFMDYAEVQFVLAEAALKGHIAGGSDMARVYYERAVTASLEKWAEFGSYSEVPVTIETTDVETFLTSELASWDAFPNKEKLIADQKYLALFWTGMEAYHEYRRKGYPELTIGEGTIYNDHILPTRFAYPNTTMATNNDNVQEAINAMGGNNDMKTPVWWSKQAIEQ